MDYYDTFLALDFTNKLPLFGYSFIKLLDLVPPGLSDLNFKVKKIKRKVVMFAYILDVKIHNFLRFFCILLVG